MELTFLGTSSGAPTRSRNVTGLAVRQAGAWDLFDCGEATQHRLLDVSLTLPKLRRVFISHLHGDHCLGLFGLLGSRSMAEAEKPLDVFGPVGLEAMVRHVLATTETHLTFPIEFHTVSDSGGVVVDDADATITAVPLDHRVTSFAWHIVEPERQGAFDVERARMLGVEPGPDFGRLQRGEHVAVGDDVVRPDQVLGPPRAGRNLVIAGDNRDPASLLDRTGSVELLVHEATYTEAVLERIGDDHGHSTAASVARAAAQADVGALLLTHFSPRFQIDGGPGHSLDDVRDEATAVYEGTLFLAADFDRYELTADGAVRRLS